MDLRLLSGSNWINFAAPDCVPLPSVLSFAMPGSLVIFGSSARTCLCSRASASRFFLQVTVEVHGTCPSDADLLASIQRCEEVGGPDRWTHRVVLLLLLSMFRSVDGLFLTGRTQIAACLPLETQEKAAADAEVSLLRSAHAYEEPSPAAVQVHPSCCCWDLVFVVDGRCCLVSRCALPP